MRYATRTIQRAHALGIPVSLMQMVDDMTDEPLDYWRDIQRICTEQHEDFQEILWALFYPGPVDGMTD